MPKAEKIARVEELSKKLDEASSVFLTDFTGLNVQDIDELRRTFSAASVQYQVVKNTLARLSAQEAGCEGLLEFLEGPTAMAFGMEDPAAPARVIKEYSKKNENLKFKAGLFDGVLIGADQIDEIASLPTKEVLLSRLAGALNAPLSNLAGSLSSILSGLATVIDAVRQQKEESNS